MGYFLLLLVAVFAAIGGGITAAVGGFGGALIGAIAGSGIAYASAIGYGLKPSKPLKTICIVIALAGFFAGSASTVLGGAALAAGFSVVAMMAGALFGLFD